MLNSGCLSAKTTINCNNYTIRFMLVFNSSKKEIRKMKKKKENRTKEQNNAWR